MNNVDWFCLGLGIGLSVSIWFDVSYRKLLALKADPRCRTPEKLGDAFYYIVPEKEYIERMNRP